MRRIDAPITAVLCMDMIDYNKDKSNRAFEIHAGHSNAEIRDSCLPLAKSIEESAERLGKLGKAQIYKGLSWGTGLPDETDREKYDGAIKRSDQLVISNPWISCSISLRRLFHQYSYFRI